MVAHVRRDLSRRSRVRSYSTALLSWRAHVWCWCCVVLCALLVVHCTSVHLSVRLLSFLMCFRLSVCVHRCYLDVCVVERCMRLLVLSFTSVCECVCVSVRLLVRVLCAFECVCTTSVTMVRDSGVGLKWGPSAVGMWRCVKCSTVCACTSRV